MASKKIKMLRILYSEAKAAEVGENCICPSCNTKFEKTNYQQAFCKSRIKTKCKDFYWNNVTPKKRNNVTRISPANAAYFNNVIEPRMNANFDDDMGWDAHKDSF